MIYNIYFNESKQWLASIPISQADPINENLIKVGTSLSKAQELFVSKYIYTECPTVNQAYSTSNQELVNTTYIQYLVGKALSLFDSVSFIIKEEWL